MATGSPKEDKSMRRPAESLFHAALFILGAVIALNIAIAYLQPILPWLCAGFVIGMTVWVIVLVRKWRRDPW